MKSPFLVFAFLVAVCSCLRADETEAEQMLERWLSNSAKIKSVQAKFEQVRLLKSMTRPLRREGMLWMEKPGRFRWQIGNPPELMVQKDENQRMWVFDVNDRKARVWDMKDMQNKELAQGGQNFAMLDSMQSMSADFLEDRFKLQRGAVDATNPALWNFDFSMKDSKAALMVKQVTLKVNVGEGTLHALTLFMRDGSSMMTNILTHQINAPIEAAVFKVNKEGYTVVEEELK
jgi:outer membrane lipoprotein-sorting protein